MDLIFVVLIIVLILHSICGLTELMPVSLSILYTHHHRGTNHSAQQIVGTRKTFIEYIKEHTFYYGYFILSTVRLMTCILQHIVCKHNHLLHPNFLMLVLLQGQLSPTNTSVTILILLRAIYLCTLLSLSPRL